MSGYFVELSWKTSALWKEGCVLEGSHSPGLANPRELNIIQYGSDSSSSRGITTSLLQTNGTHIGMTPDRQSLRSDQPQREEFPIF